MREMREDRYTAVTFRREIAKNLNLPDVVSINSTAADWLIKKGDCELVNTFNDSHESHEEIQLEHMPTMVSLGLRELDLDKESAAKLTNKIGWVVSKFCPPDTYRLVNFPRSGSTWLRLMLTYVYIWNWDRGNKHARALGPNNEVDELVRWAPYVVPHLYSQEARSKKGSPFPRFRPKLYRVHRNTFTARHPKVVYMVRDGRSATASFYTLNKKRGLVKPTESIASFIERDTMVPGGGWGFHVKQWIPGMSHKHPNLLVVRYEDLIRNPQIELSRVCKFLGLNAPEHILDRAVRATDIDRVRAVWHLNVEKRFVRSGKIDSWTSIFDERAKELFKEKAQKELEILGYVNDDRW